MDRRAFDRQTRRRICGRPEEHVSFFCPLMNSCEAPTARIIGTGPMPSGQWSMIERATRTSLRKPMPVNRNSGGRSIRAILMMASLAKRSMSDPSSWGSTGASIQEKPACSSAVETTENTERSSLTRRGHNSLGQIRACQFRGQPITGEVAKADQRLSVSENDRCVVDAAPKIWRGVFKGDQNVNV